MQHVLGTRREGQGLTYSSLRGLQACCRAVAPQQAPRDVLQAEERGARQEGREKVSYRCVSQNCSLWSKNWRALEAASSLAELGFAGSLLRSVQELSGAPAARWRKKKVSFLTLTLKFLD